MDRPLALVVLDYGCFEVNEGRRRVPITGYLIVAPERVALVDTGFPARYVDDRVGASRADGLDSFGRVVSLSADNLVLGQLAVAGFAPGDITDLLITHGDIDHVGGIDQFPDATLVVGRAELEFGAPRYFGSVRPVAWPSPRMYRLVDGDEELFPGVDIISTPGHSPGHLSLLVRLKRSGCVLLAGDAISRPEELASGHNGGASDQTAARDSALRLVDLARQESARLIYGHDCEQWSGLLKAPYSYD